MTTMTEEKRSSGTARAFLVKIVNSLMENGVVSDSKIGPIAVSTVTAPDGSRYNVSVHRISTGNEVMQKGDEPVIRPNRPRIRD